MAIKISKIWEILILGKCIVLSCRYGKTNQKSNKVLCTQGFSLCAIHFATNCYANMFM